MTEILTNRGLEVETDKEVIEVLGKQLLDLGFVKETYIEAVLEREAILPTGLRTGVVNVAIPHTDVTHVNQTAVSISTLMKPVKFYLMEDPSQEIYVDIVFLLAVKQPEEQVQLLKNLIAIFQNKELLERIANEKDRESLNQILISALAFA